DEENTIDAVHTEAQYLVPNKKTELTKDISVEFVRDPFRIKFLQERNVQSDGTTSLSGDDEICILDCVELSPNTTRSITASFTHGLEDGNLKLLNNGSFNWSLLGIQIDNEFTIDATENTGTYTVENIEFNVLTLTPVSATPSFTGTSLKTVTYPITGVLYTNRTNEGFSEVTGVENPNEYSNLNYTIRRNLERWKPYIATSMLYNRNDVTNTKFVNNPTLSTTKTGGQPLEEISGIEKTDLNNAILSAKTLKTTLTGISFREHSTIINDIRNDKGYLRLADNTGRMVKVHPTKTDYTWATNVLEIEGEIRLESQFLEVSKIGGIVKINETGYPTDLVYPIRYEAIDDFIQLFDNNLVPLTNKKRFDFVKVNNNQYDTVEDLIIALSAL
ncbi:MAG: hypothetical protein AB8F74_19575, partial [Saprospiraceae bacterium]